MPFGNYGAITGSYQIESHENLNTSQKFLSQTLNNIVITDGED